MAQTLSEKIIARAAGRASVRPGEIVTCKVDLAMMHARRPASSLPTT
jgi:3-isopropylmalate/(R)-2-methylmalate dehydratase large subunit